MRMFIQVWSAAVALACALPAYAADVDAAVQAYIDVPFRPADGFQFHRGKGKHSPIRAPAYGRVVRRSDDSVGLEHVVYANHQRLVVKTEADGFASVDVQVGTDVTPKTVLGKGRVRWRVAQFMVDENETFLTTLRRHRRRPVTAPEAAVDDVNAWAQRHRQLFDPTREDVLVIVRQQTRTLHLLQDGVVTTSIRAGFGQAEGKKVRQGDNKTPRGMYFVVQKYRGEFKQKYGEYYGGHWIKVNYPNAYDAERGVQNGWISRRQANTMARKWRKRELPWGGSKLGGGIGLHGWAGSRTTYDDWSDDDPWLSWGCVVLHNVDIQKLYDHIPKGTMVILR